MINDYPHLAYNNEKSQSEVPAPKPSSISFLKQFARVYTAIEGVHFSYFILN
ncbi:MAG: hypothetical protein J1F38_09180 [Muribaculaceae bacterium]|nr:hypothetical protein [Muribaculaceae bacterium]